MTAVQDAEQLVQIGVDGDDDTARSIGALHERALKDLSDARETIRQLTEAVASNRDIGAATGILMALHGLTQPEAFDRLQLASQRRNIKLRDVAREVLYTGALDRTPR